TLPSTVRVISTRISPPERIILVRAAVRGRIPPDSLDFSKETHDEEIRFDRRHGPGARQHPGAAHAGPDPAGGSRERGSESGDEGGGGEVPGWSAGFDPVPGQAGRGEAHRPRRGDARRQVRLAAGAGR